MAVLRTLAAVLLIGCGLGAAPGGGSDNLPVSGVGPYLQPDEPFVLSDPAADVSDPSAIALPDGGFRIWYTRAGAEIWRVDLAEVGAAAGEPVRVLVADRPWEGTAVRAPSVAAAPGGGVTMVYQAAGRVGLAESADGVVWTKGGPLGAGVDPTVIYRGDERVIYVGGGGVIRTLDGEEVLRAATDATAFDSAGASQPAAAFGTTVAGRPWIGLAYVGTNASGATAIGFAGSEDGRSFTRTPRARPALPPRGENHAGPAAPVVLTDRAVLFFHRRRVGKLAIAAAVSTAQ